MNPTKRRTLLAWPCSRRSDSGFSMRALLFLLLLMNSFANPAGSSTRRPNILLAVADDWSFAHAGAYGCTWVQTPAFDQIAESGLLFTRAFTPNAKCAPSRAAILTGRNSWQLEEAAKVPF